MTDKLHCAYCGSSDLDFIDSPIIEWDSQFRLTAVDSFTCKQCGKKCISRSYLTGVSVSYFDEDGEDLLKEEDITNP